MTNANTNDALTVNRTFKSTLFIMLFEDRKNLLKLSDMYSVKEEKPKLELEATLLNISGTNNRKLKEAAGR